MSEMNPETPTWYVLTGAPTAGKSTLIGELANRGYRTMIEAARYVIEKHTAEGEDLAALRKDAQRFQQEVLQVKIDWEAELPRDQVIFLDRGIPDTIAYYRHEGIPIDDSVEIAMARAAYQRVFILDLISEENFVHDGARTETWEGACELDHLLEEAYASLGFDVVRVPVLAVPERADFVIQHLNHV